MSSPHEESREELRVLVVCEPGAALEMAAQSLTTPYMAQHFSTPYRAVAEFARNHADIVLLDLDTFVAHDLDAIRVMREVHPDVRIIVGFSDRARERAVEAIAAGADAYLLQPFYPAEFLAMVSSAGATIGRQARSAGDREGYLAAVRNLALGLAHEINNPLATISGWFQMFAEDAKATEEDRRRFQSLSEECDRIAAVVRRLSDLGEEECPGVRARVRLDEIVGDVVKSFGPRHANGVRIESSLEAAGVDVVGDAGRIGEALELLLKDACDALDGKGRVRVETVPGPEMVEVRIADNGRSIPDSDFLDEPYAVKTRSRNDLALVYAACSSVFRSHGGGLDAEVAADGDNVFVVRLPIAKT